MPIAPPDRGAAPEPEGSTLALVKALVARPSVTPADGGCQDLLARRLQASGFAAERFDRNGVSNLWLRRGSNRPAFVFAGHTDVVPPGQLSDWHSAPFQPTERDGFLYGRGAADMKTSLAAFTVAAEQFVAAQPDHAGSIALLLTSDEEGPAVDGTLAVVQALAARGESIDYCLVGEPSCNERLGDTIKVGRRGSLSCRLVVAGIQGHVAYPERARNPVHEFAPALEELTSTRWDEGDDDFPPTTLQVSAIHAGTGAGNVIPGRCEIDFNLRYCPLSQPDALRERVESILYSHELDFSAAWTVGARPFRSGPGVLVEALCTAIEDTVALQPARSTSGGTSDGRYVAAVCPQVVEFGPTNATIHQIDERVRLAEIEPLKEIYRRTLATLLGR